MDIIYEASITPFYQVGLNYVTGLIASALFSRSIRWFGTNRSGVDRRNTLSDAMFKGSEQTQIVVKENLLKSDTYLGSGDSKMKLIKPSFFDTMNYAICQAVNERLGEEAKDFFKRVGEFHLEEALERGLLKIEPDVEPLDALIQIARYLESTGYMESISINKLSEKEAIVEMKGVSVTESSAKLLGKDKHPSHFMTNTMFAALKKLGVQADLRDMDYNVKEAHFKEYWKIL
jgi:hypothetical protein